MRKRYKVTFTVQMTYSGEKEILANSPEEAEKLLTKDKNFIPGVKNKFVNENFIMDDFSIYEVEEVKTIKS